MKRKMGLDRQVWFTMLIVSIISLGLAAYKTVTDKPCAPLNIEISGINIGRDESYFVNDVVSFSVSIRNNPSQNISWDFGDNTPVIKGAHVNHIYARDGAFTVTATTNGNCTDIKVVNVRKQLIRRQVIGNQVLTSQIMEGNFTPRVNERINYRCLVTASSYEWRILDRNNFPIQTTREAMFSFASPHPYILQLKLDNDISKTFTRTIYVAPIFSTNSEVQEPSPSIHIPPAPNPTPTPTPNPNPPTNPTTVPRPSVDTTQKIAKFKEVSEGHFRRLLEGVLEGTKDVHDFDELLCEGVRTHVIINDETNWRFFEDLCNMIRGKKNNRKIDWIKVNRDDNKCVINLQVGLKKKNIIGKWVDL
jgi:PKD repeat protein